MKYLFRNPRAVILNDTRRDSNHFGCRLVMENLLTLCSRNNIDVIGTLQAKRRPTNRDFRKSFLSSIRRADIIILNGEGSLHHDKGLGLLEQAALAVRKRKKVFLINSVWEDNPDTKDYLDCFKLAAFRETRSQKGAQADGAADAICVPDLSLYTIVNDLHQQGAKVTFTDSVMPEISDRLHALAAEMSAPMHPMNEETSVPLTMTDVSTSQVLVGGRFHALCMALVAGTPALTVESNTHKISAVLTDIGIDLNAYLLSSADQICSEAVEAFARADHTDFRQKSGDYVSDARTRIENLFQRIRDLA